MGPHLPLDRGAHSIRRWRRRPGTPRHASSPRHASDPWRDDTAWQDDAAWQGDGRRCARGEVLIEVMPDGQVRDRTQRLPVELPRQRRDNLLRTYRRRDLPARRDLPR
ncbi:hypothetical protein, partial [Micromonospora olivasterospora]